MIEPIKCRVYDYLKNKYPGNNGDKSLNNRCASPDSVETVSFDAGWQTRGSGRNYACHTGNFIYN